MKSIFTKLGTLLLCGAVVALVGCTDFSSDLDEVNDKVAAQAAELSALKSEIANLQTELENTYATQETVEDLISTIATLQNALDSKADAATIQAAIDALQAAIDDLTSKHSEDITAIYADITTLTQELKLLKETVAGLSNYDDTAVKQAIASLTTKLDTLSSSLNEYKELVDGKLADITVRLTDIESALLGLQNAIDAINTALASKASTEELNAAIAQLEQAIEDAKYNDTELKAAIASLTAQYNTLVQDVESLKTAYNELRSVLRSIVTVPEVMVNGVKAIEFSSFSYAPLSADNTPAAERVVKPGEAAHACYLFNPTTFDISKAVYSIVSEEAKIVTKSAGEAAATITKIEAVTGAEKGRVQVTLARGEGAGNMIALAATLGDGAVIYSDYAMISDNNVNGEDLVLVNDKDVELANAANVELKEGETLDFAKYVKVRNHDISLYGLALNYEVAEGLLNLEGTVATATKEAYGLSTVKVEIIDPENNNNVVRREYVTVKVLAPAVYIQATANAAVTAERVAFEIGDIATWAKNLKDQPNTIELVKNAAAAIEAGDYELAMQYLGGVPGFVKKQETFTGVGVAKVKVVGSVDEAFESLVPEIEKIATVADLKAFLEKLEGRYDASVYEELLGDAAITDYIPSEQITTALEKIPAVGGYLSSAFEKVVAQLEGYKLTDILNNETVVNLINQADSYLSSVDFDAIDLSSIKTKLSEIVTKIEEENNAALAQTAEEAAKVAAIAEASALAYNDVVANFNAANEQIAANFENGTWGISKKVVESDLATQVFNALGLTDVHTALKDLFEYGYVLAQYDRADLVNTKITSVSTERIETYE